MRTDYTQIRQGTWASVDFGVKEGSWNQSPVDTEGQLQKQVPKMGILPIPLLGNWFRSALVFCCYMLFCNMSDLQKSCKNLILESCMPFIQIPPIFYHTVFFLLTSLYIYIYTYILFYYS